MIEGQLLGLTATLTSASPDYYYHWKSREMAENNRADFINVHENIKGGFGIFTLNSRDVYAIEL